MGIHAIILAGQTAQAAVTSASVTTLFLNRRSSSSSDEHLGLRSRKALGPGTHPAPHPRASLILGWKCGSMLGRWALRVEERAEARSQ